MKYLLGFIGCAVLLLFLLVLYHKTQLAKQRIQLEETCIKSIINDHRRTTANSVVNDICVKQLTLEEKISSINKRFDDLYILGALIITLLLAINIGIFVRTDTEVAKYFRENFEQHINAVEKYRDEAGKLLGQIQATQASIENTKKSSNDQTPV